MKKQKTLKLEQVELSGEIKGLDLRVWVQKNGFDPKPSTTGLTIPDYMVWDVINDMLNYALPHLFYDPKPIKFRERG